MEVDRQHLAQMNVAEIDRQHEELHVCVSALLAAIRSKAEAGELRAALGSLYTSAEKHFTTEEAYFQRFPYGGNDQHRQEHRRFMERLGALQTQWARGHAYGGEAVAAALNEWLGTHLSATDKPYFDQLHEEGLI